MLIKERAEEIAQKVLDVMETETERMIWMDGLSSALYVATKILIGLIDAGKAEHDPIVILGVMNVKNEIDKKWNSLSNETKEKVNKLKEGSRLEQRVFSAHF